VDRYPAYATDLCCSHLLPLLLRRRGCRVASRLVCLGAPIITAVPGARIEIGAGVVLCSRSRQTALGVTRPVILRALRRGALLRLGDRVRMSGTVICAAQRVEIGDRCVIGSGVLIADTDFHALDPETRAGCGDADAAAAAPVIVGPDVFIGANSIVLKGVTLGAGTVVGAGSVVTRSTEPRAIVAGNPARVIG
jgi:acetyltransferase-like isoleucine patch superfamily enzyme